MNATLDNASAVPRPKNEPDPSTYLGRVALRLTALRTAARKTVPEAAKSITAAGYRVSLNTVYSWEQARSTPHVEALPAIAQAYGLKRPGSVLPDA